MAHPALDTPFLVLTTLGDGWVLVPLVVLGLWMSTRDRAAVSWYLLGAAVGGTAVLALKWGISAPRPLAYFAPAIEAGQVQLHVVGEPLYRLSFPSGHTQSAAYTAVFLFGLYGRRAAPALVLAALVGLSRIYVGAHFFIDVVAGAALGSLAGWLTLRARSR